MVRKEVTLVVVPNYQNKSYSKTLSLTTLRILLGILIVLIIGLGTAIFMTTRFYYQMLRINYLTRRNAQLETEHAKLQVLKERLVKLEEESQKIKNMLGVDKSPPKVDFLNLTENEVPIAVETTKSTKNLLSPELANQLKNEKIQYTPAQAPLVNYVISKGFNLIHTGVDLVAPLGTPVSATADGLIKDVGEDSIYGKYVLIQHGPDYTSFYGHLSRTIKTKGDKVTKGNFIGYLGATGQVSAPHLHFEIIYKGEKVDPAKILRLKSPR
jgi:murein DD-endopeptidase MepM/ murein hydrolase activator NlpD